MTQAPVVDEKKQLAESWNIAGVWMATHCGPGCAAGTQACLYFIVMGGYLGVYWAFLSMVILGIIYFFGSEMSRLTGKRTYQERFRVMWGDKVATALWWLVDITTIYGTIVAFSSIFAGANAVFQMFLGTPIIVGGLVIAVVGTFLCFFGGEFMAKINGILTVALITTIMISAGVVLAANPGAIGEILSSKWTSDGNPVSVWSGINGIITYIGIQIGFNTNCSVVAQKLYRRKDTRNFIIIGTILNGAMVGFITLAMFCYVPEVITEGIPFLYAIQHAGPSWFSWFYFILYVIALISTVISMSYNIGARFGPMLNKVAKKLSANTCIGLSTAIITVISLFISLAGILAIVAVGYNISSKLNTFLWTIPMCIIVPYKVYKWRKEELAGKRTVDPEGNVTVEA